MLNLAGDVDPGTEHDIVHQGPIQKPRQQAGMAQALLGVDRIAVAHVGGILGGEGCRHQQRPDAEPATRLQAFLAGRRTLLDGGHRGERLDRRWARRAHRGMAAGAQLLAASDLDLEAGIGVPRRDGRQLTVVDRLVQARFDAAVLEKVAPPAGHRWMGHVGDDIDAGNEPTGKAELARDGVVVHFVFGLAGAVVGQQAIGLAELGHVRPSFRPTPEPRRQPARGSSKSSSQAPPQRRTPRRQAMAARARRIGEMRGSRAAGIWPQLALAPTVFGANCIWPNVSAVSAALTLTQPRRLSQALAKLAALGGTCPTAASFPSDGWQWPPG